MRAVKKASAALEDDVEAASAAVAPMSAADGGDFGRMTRRGEPVVDRGADPAALDRRSAWPVVAGDQQQTCARRRRSIARARCRSHARRNRGSFRADRASGPARPRPSASFLSQLPSRVCSPERGGGPAATRTVEWRGRGRGDGRRPPPAFGGFPSRSGRIALARQRADGRGDLGPQLAPLQG